MHKNFQYRLYPTKKQVKKLNETLEECRWLYNHLLAKRKDAYEQEGKSLTCYGQINTFPILKEQRPSLERVHSQVLQNVAIRIDLAFKAFFRRVKAGTLPGGQVKKPGYPRFKGYGRYDSFTYPQSGFSITHDDRVTLSKIKMPLEKRVYECPCCQLVLDRDHNASLNILCVGLHTLGLALEAPCLKTRGVITYHCNKKKTD